MPESFLYTQLEFVSLFGNNELIALFILFSIAGFLAYHKYRTEAGLVVLTAASFPYSLLLKSFFRQTRPLTAILDNTFIFNSYSFPSSHVVFYTVFFGYVIYLTFKLKRLNKLGVNFIRVFSLYFLLLVGISRVYLGMHWISDVIGGYIFGGIFLGLILYLDKTMTKNQK